jgi:hypothetical protein
MDHLEGESPGDRSLASRNAQLEQMLARTHGDLADAIRAQQELQVQLRAAIDALSQAARHPKSNGDSETNVQRLESRVRGIEQRLEKTSEQLQGVLQSRIWQTLVKAGSFLLRLNGSNRH